MTRRLILALLTAAAFLPLAVSADDKPAKPTGDLAKLQGKWSGKAKIANNQEMPLLLTFAANAVTVHGTTPDGHEFDIKGEIKLDEQAKPQTGMDWVKFTDPKGDPLPDRPGIYAFDGDDTLKVQAGGANGPRPEAFTEGEGALIVFKREAAK